MGALSDRAKRRLQLLAGLLRSSGMRLDMPREQFYEEVQKTVGGLSAERQAELKAMVDWLEDYERGEEAWSQSKSGAGR
jgi:hypothetical protein